MRTEQFIGLASSHQVPGAQLVAGDVALTSGRRAHDRDEKVTPETKFPVGSITKVLTAMLIVELAADGDLDLDEPFGNSLASLCAGRPAGEVTPRQVLSHTGGLVSAVEPEPGTTTRGYLAACAGMPLLFEPGTAFSYSNVGYVFLGALVTATTGMSWDEAVEDVLLGPLGVHPEFAGAGRPDRKAAFPVAAGHTVHSARGVTFAVEQSIPWVLAPAGGLALSAVDLGVIARALIDDERYAVMRAPVTVADPYGMADGWGLGLALYRRGGTTWWGHDGTGDGTSCHLRFEPQSGAVVAFTAGAGTGLSMWEELVGVLRADGLEVGSTPFATVPGGVPLVPPPDGCTGSFRNGDTHYSILTRPDGHLYYAVEGRLHSRLELYTGLEFAMSDLTSDRLTYVGRFLRDPDTGGLDRIQVSGRLATRTP